MQQKPPYKTRTRKEDKLATEGRNSTYCTAAKPVLVMVHYHHSSSSECTDFDVGKREQIALFCCPPKKKRKEDSSQKALQRKGSPKKK